MDDRQLLTAVAVAVATGADDGLTEDGRVAFAALTRLVRDRVGDTRADGPVEDRIAALHNALIAAAARDPALVGRLAEAWATVRERPEDTGAPVRNSVSGTVQGHVVQARDIQGGIRFGG